MAEVRSRARIEDVVGAVVALRNAGGGSLKGLCPFHDEKTPSFQVTPSKGLYYCFGCGEGGDVIGFVMRHDNVTFVEAIEQLADRTGVVLRYVEGDGPRSEPGLRTKVLEANLLAAEFYARRLGEPAALAGRQFLDSRGFDRAVAEQFGVGWAPQGGRELLQFLQSKGFDRSALVRAGLVRESGWDFFQGRVLWPIRDASRHVVGFGARRIFDDDRMPAKYLNTPETPVYKKSQVLYGLDMARRAIAQKSQAVVVEGYTDVMAAHLAGVDTAVASCGTAFGADHARTLQRLLGAQAGGEVVFTFDGDAAGQAAAVKVFALDSAFITQTYVAIEPTGLDPCDLRLQHGEAAVRELVARRVPLYRFVMGQALDRYDLDRADGRLAALRAAAPLVAGVRDQALVGQYARELAGLIGMEVDEVRREVARASRGQTPEPAVVASRTEPRGDLPWPDARDRSLAVERGFVKLVVQRPDLLGADWDGISADDFTHPAYRAIWEAALQAAGTPAAGEWSQRLREASPSQTVQQLVIALAVEQTLNEPDRAYVEMYAATLKLRSVDRAISTLKSRIQRTNPVDQDAAYRTMFGELIGMEAQRKELLLRTIGARE